MAKGITLDKKEEYELIEKRIVGYTLTTSEPADWSANYTDYFTNTGTPREPVYTAVTGEVAPTWTSGTYYSYSSTDITDIYLTTEPDGTPYNFKKILISATQPTSGGNFRTNIKLKSLSTGAENNIYIYPQTEYGSTSANNYTLGMECEINKVYNYTAYGKFGNTNSNLVNDGWQFNNRFAKKLIVGDEYIYAVDIYNCLIKANSQIIIWAVRT